MQQFNDVEVSGEVVRVLLDALEARGLFEQVPPSLASLGESKRGDFRLSWTSYCALVDLAHARLGDEGLRQIASESLDIPRFRRRARIARRLLTIQDAYRYFLQTRSNPDLPNVSSIVVTGPGRIEVFGYLSDRYVGSKRFFVGLEGAFHRMLDLFGVEGDFSSEISARRAHYRFLFKERTGPLAGIKQFWSRKLLWLLTLPNIVRIIEVLDARSLELQEELNRRRSVESRLERSEQAMRRRIENIRDVIFEFNDRRQLEYVSPNVEASLGYTADELMEDPMRIFPQEHRGRVEELFNHDHGAEVYQLNLGTRDGAPSWFELSISRFTVDGSRRVLLVARDINERRALDARALDVQKLETLGVVAGGIAHDFNNLLVPILGNADLLIESMPLDSEQREQAVSIRNAADRAAELTRQLLVHAGDRAQVHSEFDLSGELAQLMDLLRASIPRKIAIEQDIAPNLTVVGDAVQLRQAIMNLVTNSAESIGDEPGLIEIRAGRADDQVRITVADSGPGMTDAHLSRIFSPLYTTKARGHGLGLAAVEAIVQAHHGEVIVDTRPGEGTTFDIWLPLSEATRTSDPQPPGARSAGPGRVMILDDEPEVRQVAQSMLELSGFDVLSFGDCDDAIAAFRQEHASIDAVMLDVMMPKMNGPEVMAVLRADRPDIPVLLVTGFGSDVDLASATAHTAILRKPYRMNELVDALGHVNPSLAASA